MPDLAVGDAVIVRGGQGVSASGATKELSAGASGTIAEVSTWPGDGSIFLVSISSEESLYVTRAQLAPANSQSQATPFR
jgi:hypothetical protein